MPYGLSLSPRASNDTLDNLAELHLHPGTNLNEPDGLGLALLGPTVISRQLNLPRRPPRAVRPLGLAVPLRLGRSIVAVASKTEQVVRDVLVVGQVNLAGRGRRRAGRGRVEQAAHAARNAGRADGDDVVAEGDGGGFGVVGDEEDSSKGRQGRLFVRVELKSVSGSDEARGARGRTLSI